MHALESSLPGLPIVRMISGHCTGRAAGRTAGSPDHGRNMHSAAGPMTPAIARPRGNREWPHCIRNCSARRNMYLMREILVAFCRIVVKLGSCKRSAGRFLRTNQKLNGRLACPRVSRLPSLFLWPRSSQPVPLRRKKSRSWSQWLRKCPWTPWKAKCSWTDSPAGRAVASAPFCRAAVREAGA